MERSLKMAGEKSFTEKTSLIKMLRGQDRWTKYAALTPGCRRYSYRRTVENFISRYSIIKLYRRSTISTEYRRQSCDQNVAGRFRNTYKLSRGRELLDMQALSTCDTCTTELFSGTYLKTVNFNSCSYCLK